MELAFPNPVPGQDGVPVSVVVGQRLSGQDGRLGSSEGAAESERCPGRGHLPGLG